ncbi:hypothetical protein [Actinospica robiniae]|uniref:hypothetical protein n=1 Tax=Actinospica robiniae TaxID=304901 RepID=UPI000401EB06|nr:hypothetical protein [Actinospica robiniae]
MSGESTLPTLRAATFAAVCLGLGTLMHAVTSQGSIPTSALTFGAIGVFAAARLAAGRGERSLLAIGGLMGASQVGLDVLFALTRHTPALQLGICRMPGMAHTALPAPSARMPMEPAAARFDATAILLIAHVLAALVWVLWLRRGEAALHAVIRCAAFRLRRVLVVVVQALAPADHAPRRPRAFSRVRSLRSQWMRGILEQRGPPRSAVYC